MAFVLRQSGPVLPVGAQSSLTGGATPFGERVLSLARMTRVGPIGSDRVRCEAGVALLTLETELRPHRLCYPPVPTFRGALVGGVASTNAAGAATFKHGSTRDWVAALTVVLANGDVLDLERGQCCAHAEGYFEVVLASGERRRVPVPRYRMPDVPKRSAGYHAEPGMDLVDLFVGAEGTLGVISEVTLRLIPDRPRLLALASFGSEARALDCVAALRREAQRTWAAHDPQGIDVIAIESLDRRCLELLREDGTDREHGVRLEATAEAAILLQVELAGAAEPPLEQLGALLEAHRALREPEVAQPGETQRATHLLELREAVPIAVNHRIGALQRTDPGVHKTAADMVVPFERLPEMVGVYRSAFARRGLDHALWGHVSDGNLHANVIPRSSADVVAGEAAILELGDEVIARGGCPMSEHGVGRSSTKQALLRRLYGEAGIAQMRAVKAALDPEWKLAPGVVFPRD